MIDYRSLCKWCYGMPGLEQCTCTDPCGKDLCPMLADGKMYPDLQPVPKFRKDDE